ncbi:MAG: twin-arginine translocation signal domain-containing protein [Bryobacteraceae bacterium]
MSLSRREFLGTAALGTLAAPAATRALPTRVLRRTGRKVTILAFGSGSRFLEYNEDTAFLDRIFRDHMDC